MVSDAGTDSNGVRIGLMTYNTQSNIIFHLNELKEKTELLERIDRVPYNYGNTNTADALRTMRMEMFTKLHGDREGVSNVAVIITDGISNMNNQLVPVEAKMAHDNGIHVIAIGINLNNFRELEIIASKPLTDNLFAVDDFTKLSEVRTDLFPTTCQGIQVMHRQKANHT